MKYQEKVRSCPKEQIWREYCGYLDMSIDEYMYIQNRLMEEQIRAWCSSGLGQKLLSGRRADSVTEFRDIMPLTDYNDYADTLLGRRAEMLPAEPIIWIQTTWEGGLRPIKLAPYTREMLDVYKHNLLSVAMLATSRGRGDYSAKKGDRVLYGGAPLPYATGLIPTLLNEDIDFVWLPENAPGSMSFSQRIKLGFRQSMRGGVDYFFGIGSVANYITENFSKSSGGGKGMMNVSLSTAVRYLRAKYNSKKTGRPVTPGDIFRLKGFVCAGTDAGCYREKLTKAWGIEPIEIAAGTETTCIGSETWEHNGMAFFPDASFYEFISERELCREREMEAYTPRTCLMNELQSGENYELVISVLHGGAFMRYRIGDLYHCLSAGSGKLPRLTFLDRVQNVIDIAGFTRITESSVSEVIAMSRLSIGDWLIKKEFDEGGTPYLHMYVELGRDSLMSEKVSVEVLREHLTVYFKYFDSDYRDLEKLLGIEPLVITVLRAGSISAYKEKTGRALHRVNPEALDVADLVRLQAELTAVKGGSLR